MALYSVLKSKVLEWRENKYQSDYPTISEIFDFNLDPETGNLRFLRKAQFEALETYWYLRLVEKTPHIFDLYKKFYDDPAELFKALNISLSQEDLIKIMSNEGINAIFEKIRNDDNFVKKNKLETLRETLSLNYPSYILALAMGAGKTILIGTIIATEFAMALEYPDDINFVKNALVFAPGKTILGALKELSDTPFEKILPDRLYKEFITSAKFTFTRDGEKDIELESIRYCLWLDPDRCCSFFADVVLICEGLSEKALIDCLVKEKKLNFKNRRVYILNAAGKYDIHRYMNLFEKLGIKHSVLFDGDTNNDKHKKINEFIEKKKNSFTLNLHKFVEGELEDFLEIEKVDDRYKKPLNVMWHYKNGEIKQEKIDALIKIIEKLVSQKEE